MKNIALMGLILCQAAYSIDNGQIAPKGEFPAVIKVSSYKNGGTSHCTGTLISPTIVITAGHCVDKFNFSEQIVSYASDETGDLSNLFKRPFKVKNIYLHPEYIETKLALELIDDYIRSDLFKKSSSYDQNQYLQKRKMTANKATNVDLAFIELKKAQNIDPENIPKISCTSLAPMTQVIIVGYGENLKAQTKENQNKSFIQYYGSNWYVNDELYELTPENGQLVNRGDSGGPLFKFKDRSIIFGIASTKLVTKDNKNLKSTYASTSSDEALHFYQTLMQSDSPRELKEAIEECIH